MTAAFPSHLTRDPQWKMCRARSLRLTDDIRIAEQFEDNARVSELLERKRAAVKTLHLQTSLFDDHATQAHGTELVVDNFAGGGGASTGIAQAIGRSVDIAINHDLEAIRTHQANHPETDHYCENILDVDPVEVCKGRPIGMAWFSPDCTHHSRAKGGKPRKKEIRGLAWIVIRWAAKVKPRVIFLENVEEFADWGPLKNGRPIRARKGETFRRWLEQLEALGYRVEHRCLAACDYGAPTTRKRLFLVARRDGEPIVWPQPTHGPGEGLKPYRTAGECIDWALPCPSIFGRKKPLVEKTLKRIAKGLQRYVIDNPEPFIITYYSQESFRGQPLDEPLRTQTTENRFGLVVPFLSHYYGRSVGSPLGAPVPTITAGGMGKVAAVSAFLTKFYGTNIGSPMDAPVPTITSGGNHLGEVRAFLVKYYGCGEGQGCDEPLHTITTQDRFGLVTVAGQQYQIVDIGMRMLQPHELAKAQGLPDDYILQGTKTRQVRMIGNSVSPFPARSLVAANYEERTTKSGLPANRS